MQVAFYLAGEITQVLDPIPWVRCASGNVFFFNFICLTFATFSNSASLKVLSLLTSQQNSPGRIILARNVEEYCQLCDI